MNLRGKNTCQPHIGYAIREPNRPFLSDPSIDAAEITFERANNSLRTSPYIGDLDFAYVSVHALRLSPACPEPPPRDYLDDLKAIADENGAVAVSDHLCLTSDAVRKTDVGFFVPCPPNQAALDAVCRNAEIIERRVGRPFYLETIATHFKLKGPMSETEFWVKLLEKSACHLLLDVTNVYANEINHGDGAVEFLREVIPAASRIQIHLAGGYFDNEVHMYVDSHSEPIPDPVFDLFRLALELGQEKVDAVFIERDQNFPDETGWGEEVRRVRRFLEEERP
jgi:uncharacterized protein